MARTYRWPDGLAVTVAVAVIGLAACSSGPSTPQVANLGNSSGGNRAGGGNSTATLPKGNPTQLLDEWAACMRSHGDSGQADPTIDANKVIHVTIALSIRGGALGYTGQDGSGGPGLYCKQYLQAAQTDLGGGQQQPQKPDLAKIDKFAQCMRANGVPAFPDPSTAGGNVFFHMTPGNGVNLASPALQKASKLCAKQTGAPGMEGGSTGPGTLDVNGLG